MPSVSFIKEKRDSPCLAVVNFPLLGGVQYFILTSFRRRMAARRKQQKKARSLIKEIALGSHTPSGGMEWVQEGKADEKNRKKLRRSRKKKEKSIFNYLFSHKRRHSALEHLEYVVGSARIKSHDRSSDRHTDCRSLRSARRFHALN